MREEALAIAFLVSRRQSLAVSTRDVRRWNKVIA
jgi:hypothetical protein